MENENILDYLDKIVDLNCAQEEIFLNYYYLTDYLRKINFKASLKNCLYVLNKNTNVLFLIKKIVEDNKEDILKGNFTIFTKDIILINLIKAYCFSTNIDYERKRSKISHVDSPILAAKEEEKLFTLYFKGNKKAKEVIALRNINLVKFFVSKQAQKYEIKDENTINDMVSAGILGMYSAIENFSLGYGKFSTYASSRIMKEIMNSLKCNKYLGVKSKYYIDKERFLSQMETQLANELKRMPTKQELADYVNISLDKLEEFNNRSISFVDIYNKDDNTNLLDIIKSNDNIDPDLTYEEMTSIFDKCNLSSIQRRNLEAYCFGNLNYNEIAKVYNISRQAVYHSIELAVKKILASREGKRYINAITNKKDYRR